MAIEVEMKQSVRTITSGSQKIEALVMGLFVLSGASGLIYQVVWSRELVLVFGNTTQAISTIVASFMIGLGAGAYVAGRFANRMARPLQFYGVLELLIGLLALLLPFEFYIIGESYRVAYNTVSPTELAFIRLGLSLIAVTPVTFLMGMTLPILVRFMVHTLKRTGTQIAYLYAANTFGAVIGTVVCGFLLIELLGLTGASYLAVLLNVSAGVGSTLLAKRVPNLIDNTAPVEEAEHSDSVYVLSAQRQKFVYLSTFVSGFIALSLEILWTRMLAEGSGSRIYVFVSILAIYLLGIALGSFCYRRYSGPKHDRLATLGGCFGGIGAAAIITVLLGSGALGYISGLSEYFILLPATLIMGYTFPLSGRLVTRNVSEAASSVGLLYMWNTAGSILGALAAAFLLAGTLGTNNSILALAAASLLTGAGLVALDERRHRTKYKIQITGMIVVTILSAGATLSGLPITLTKTQNSLHSSGLSTKHLEDNLATVDSLGGPPAQRRLFVGGVGMTHLTVDTKLMAYLPKSLRPQAEDFLIIALGMGSTYRSALLLGMRVDAVELSPSVPGQMPVFYADADKFLNHPKGKIIIADGRNYVRLSNKRYDLIAADPPPPIQSAGTVVLYTHEFLEQGKQRLNPEGVFMLWIPYDETLDDFKDHLRTFRASFKHTAVVFSPGHNGVYMFGSDDLLNFDDTAIHRILNSDTAQGDLSDTPDFRSIGKLDWAKLIERNLWLTDSQVDAFVGPGPLITDDRPRTEYYLLRSMMAKDKELIGEELLRAVWKP